jgi:membrane associated rhomboid family serine protease
MRASLRSRHGAGISSVRVETCYRHPDRETGVSCSSCGRAICPDCMTPTPVGMRCPECARQRTKVRTARNLSGDPTLTYVLIGICVAVQLGQSLSGAGAVSGGLGSSEIFRQGALYGPAVAAGDYWRLVTSGFLHAGLLHLFFNMYLLYILGSMLEPAIGRLQFGILYFVSLLCGSFGVLIVSPHSLAVGASGAVFGLMGAAVVILRNRGIDPRQSGLPFLIGLNLLFTFLVPGISIGAHLGGLIGGAVAAVLLYEVPDRIHLPRIGAELLAGALGVAVAVASVAIA